MKQLNLTDSEFDALYSICKDIKTGFDNDIIEIPFPVPIDSLLKKFELSIIQQKNTQDETKNV